MSATQARSGGHKMSDAQKRVMAWMSKGWSARQAHGCAVHINGQRVCNIDTMTALERAGYVERDSRWSWVATDAGRALADSFSVAQPRQGV